ncbi:hypothetical protein FTUN_7995 [Frigoriglobus tundricola]|uniref:Uncharacterized protein n=1 Tax=Frigoriglobus tundricola TaxID=2774151 RepID=A0A6M5Z2R8_9BACT|nr:hypothetical protein FTUN_7995 [Frigoriglobus tundricola]
MNVILLPARMSGRNHGLDLPPDDSKLNLGTSGGGVTPLQ